MITFVIIWTLAMGKIDKSVSPAELEVLEILWEKSPLSASQIVDEMHDVNDWHSRTVKSLINRLLKKKIVGYKQAGNRYLYFPLLKKSHYVKKSSRGFIQRLFGGKLSPLVAHFAKHEKISQQEIKVIKVILQELESDD